MTEKKDADVEKDVDPALPAIVKAAPELIPLWDWWVKEGKSTLVMLLVIALGFLGFIGIRNYLHGRNAAAGQAIQQSSTLDELNTAVSEYGSSSAGVGLKLRLAKTHFDSDHFQDALDLYEAVLKDMDKDDPFRDIAELGRAFSLEGLKKYAEASEAYAAYASDEAKSHDGFRLTAKPDGVLRVMKKDGQNCTQEQATRIAWRNIKDWIAAQIALVETEQASMQELFLPYLVISQKDAPPQTLYEKFEGSQYMLPEA